MASKGWTVARVAAGLIVRIAWTSTMILVPLFGFWLASSLAAYSNASPWLALLVGLLLFPLVPVGWELFAAWRKSRTTPDAKQILTRLDRLVLRTLLVNGVFLGIMAWRAPETAARALAVRGDWILDGHRGEIAGATRNMLLGLADRIERHWHVPTEDHYGKSDDAPDAPAPTPDVPTLPASEWPLAAEPDVQVTDMPAEAQTSIATVAQYLKDRFPEPKRLAKAVHDYVVLRLHYDDATLAAIVANDDAHAAPQDAETVFATRTGVCEGYARLVVALGRAAGLDVAYITGYIRDAHRRVSTANATGTDANVKTALEGYGHAWNAVKIDGQWLLLDATWDDPRARAGEPAPARATYLFTPPKLFRYDHLPEDPAWQLVAPAMSPGDFVRQPLLTPYAGQLGITLESPTRSQVTVDDGVLEIVVDNPHQVVLAADAHADTGIADPTGGTRDGSPGTACTVAPITGTTHARIECKLARGEYEIRLYGVPAEVVAAAHGSYTIPYVGSLLANER